MPSSISSLATPSRRPPKATIKPKTTKVANSKKKLPEGAVETTAEVFFSLFKELPGAVRGRIVQKIEEYEAEAQAAQLTAKMTANPEDYDPQRAIPLAQAVAEYEALHHVRLGDTP